jgi:hypothetical protein
MLAAALGLGAAPALAEAQGALLVEEHGLWTSRIARDPDELRFRAASVAVIDGAAVVLAFDRFPGACEGLYTSLHVTLPRPSTESVVVLDDVGFVRVDERAIRKIKFHARVRAGEATVFLEITRVLGDAGLFADLRRGQTVRFKLGTERTTYYVAFPLDGFSAAVDRTLSLCRKNDRRARELTPPRQPKPRGKEDHAYFDD